MAAVGGGTERGTAAARRRMAAVEKVRGREGGADSQGFHQIKIGSLGLGLGFPKLGSNYMIGSK